MMRIQKISALITLFVGISLFYTDAIGQTRYTYQSLVNQNRTPAVHFDFIYLPGDDGNTEVTILYKINYNFLNFRRQVVQGRDQTTTQFTSDVSIDFDFYDADTDPVPQQPYIKRESWASSITVKEYAQTQDHENFLNGKITVQLPPQGYRLIPTISVNGREVSGARFALQAQPQTANLRGRRAAREMREAEQRRGLIEVPDLSGEDIFRVIFLENQTAEFPLKAFNFGRNVRYAEDFSVLTSYRTDLKSDSIQVRLHEIGATTVSTSSPTKVWQTTLNADNASGIGKPRFTQHKDSISVTIDESIATTAYKIVTIPNHRFKNAWFRLDFINWADGDSTSLSQTQYLSRWTDMPTSLLNLDVAIDMLRFIVENDKIRELRRGSDAEKEQKFRVFWAERDPTPDTDFNEIMAEYYRRIDHAFKEFTTPSRIGFESDQGKTYIIYGPPDNIERRLPTSGAATEVWTYGSQSIIFRATTGFGDFQLVSPSN